MDDSASWTGTEAQPDPFAWHEIRLRGGDGALRHAIVTAQAVGPDEIPIDAPRLKGDAAGGLLIMVTDVTPLKQAEEALREKESVLRSFYESSVLAMGVVELTDDDTHFINAPRVPGWVSLRRTTLSPSLFRVESLTSGPAPQAITVARPRKRKFSTECCQSSVGSPSVRIKTNGFQSPF